jgi:hypothetical protein
MEQDAVDLSVKAWDAWAGIMTDRLTAASSLAQESACGGC